jgi:hypothetical protein
MFVLLGVEGEVKAGCIPGTCLLRCADVLVAQGEQVMAVFLASSRCVGQHQRRELLEMVQERGWRAGVWAGVVDERGVLGVQVSWYVNC